MAKSILSEFDIVHTHHPHSGFYGKLIAKRLGKPIVHTEHNNHDGFTRKGRIANGITNTFTDTVVCVSESVRESFTRWEDIIVNDRKICVINNGVNIDRLEAAKELEWSIHDVADIDTDATVVGSAGMLTEQKGQDVLIEAVDQANAESEQQIELVISGDGPLRDELGKQIANAEYSDRLHLLGFLERREQVYKMMHEIDIYAMSSRWEGFCVAALEGLATGTPCIFSDIPEFKRPFEGVARFHTVNDTNSLSGEIISLITASSEGIGKKGREKVLSEHRLQKTAKKYVDLYDQIS
jgi:glycosyltransferase involved in cell wall biosynthesis